MDQAPAYDSMLCSGIGAASAHPIHNSHRMVSQIMEMAFGHLQDTVCNKFVQYIGCGGDTEQEELCSVLSQMWRIILYPPTLEVAILK